MKKQEINLETIDNDPIFENETVVATRSEGLSDGILRGSYVIIPKSQVNSPFLLTKEEWQDTFLILQEIKSYLDKKYQPDGYNIGWNIGSIAGQNVDHAHLHVLPRYKDEPLAGKGIRFMFKNQFNNSDK